jgi:DNA-binding MltR family transcriptional regulator
VSPIETLPVDEKYMHALFQEESDRGAAVLAGSYAENVLGLYLQTFMVDRSAKLVDRMFGSNGSLSTFSQRIDFAQAFGHLTAEDCADLHLVRKIRNHFAHHPKEASFSKAPVKDMCALLGTAKRLNLVDAAIVKMAIERLPYLLTITKLIMLYNQKVYGYGNPGS